MSKIQGVLVSGFTLKRYEVEHSLEAFKELVEGNYGEVPLGMRYIAIINDDDELLGLPLNILGIHGKAFIVKVNNERKMDSWVIF